MVGLKRYLFLLFLVLSPEIHSQILIYGDHSFPVSGSVNSIAFSDDNRFVACGTQSGTIHVWDLTAKKQLHELKHGATVNSLLIDSKSRFVVAGGNRELAVWDLYSGNKFKSIPDYKGKINHLALNPEETILAVSGTDENIFLFQFPEGNFIGNLRNGHSKEVIYSAFINGGDQVISVGKDNQFILWETSTKRVLRKSEISPRTINGSGIEVETARVLADKESILIACQETRLDKGGKSMIFKYNTAVYNLKTGMLDRIIEGNTRNIQNLGISPDENIYVTDNSGARLKKINFWNISTGEVVKNHDIGTEISCLDICRTGVWLAVAAGTPDSKQSEMRMFRLSGMNEPAPQEIYKRVDNSVQVKPDQPELNINIPSLPMKINGRYFALIIGINDYDDPDIIDLDAPIKDAEGLYELLTGSYTFNREDIFLLKNPKNHEIIEALDKLERLITQNDNLLIFYAGHGKWDRTTNRGYWLPSDASLKSTANWFRNSTLTDYIASIKSKHTLLIADACFAGSIFKTRNAEKATRAINRLYEKPSRKAMTSGTLEEVPDVSIFLKYLKKNLTENQEEFLPSEQLFYGMKAAVLNNSNNIPQFGEVKDAGDEGGDFIFVKRKQ